MSNKHDAILKKNFGADGRLLDSTGGKTTWGSMGIGAVMGTYAGLKRGDGFGTSLIKGVANSALWAVAPGIARAPMIYGMSKAAVGAGMRISSNFESRNRESGKIGTDFRYTDTQQAQTMRQAAVQAIQGSKMNARNSLGGEAALMHKSNLRR